MLKSKKAILCTPKLVAYQWLNEILYPVWGKRGGVEQKELYKMQIYYNKYLGRRNWEWLELGEFSFSVSMEKLHEIHPISKNSWRLVIRQKIPKYSGTHLCLLSVHIPRETVEHG